MEELDSEDIGSFGCDPKFQFVCPDRCLLFNESFNRLSRKLERSCIPGGFLVRILSMKRT